MTTENKHKNIKQVEKELRKKFQKHHYVHIFFNNGMIDITDFKIFENKVFLYYLGSEIGYIDYESINGIFPLD